jgi:hypothetical protein
LTESVPVLTAVGIAGGILIAVSSYWVAAIPVFFRQPNRAVISALPISGLIPRCSASPGCNSGG